MELKKTPQADLQNKRGLFMEIGLLVSLLAVILLFSFSQSEKIVEDVAPVAAIVEDELMEVTRQDTKPPTPVQQTIAVVSDIIQIVKDDAKVETSFDFNEFSEDIEFVPQAPQVEEVVEDVPFMVAEEMPSFRGGDLNSFRTWVMNRLKYPVIAMENGIQGRVTLQFVVERDGSVGRIAVLASPDQTLADEAVRVIQSSPKWSPGKQRSTPVPIKYTLPVDFRIQ
ncbi:MAG: energy transducer TonB [Rikenellaceae bacterium]